MNKTTRLAPVSYLYKLYVEKTLKRLLAIMPRINLHNVLHHQGNTFSLLHSRQLVIVLPEYHGRGLPLFHIWILSANRRVEAPHTIRHAITLHSNPTFLSRSQTNKTADESRVLEEISVAHTA